MKKKAVLYIGLIIFFLMGLAGQVQAQFIGISVDSAFSYTAAPGSVTGGSVGITHPVPFVPNIGGMTVSYIATEEIEEEVLDLKTSVKIESGELYYHIPFPLVSLLIGVGAGQLTATTEVVVNSVVVEEIESVAPIAEGFLRVGLPFWNFLDFHVGYHSVIVSAIDRVEESQTDLSAYTINKENYSGGLATVGILLAF